MDDIGDTLRREEERLRRKTEMLLYRLSAAASTNADGQDLGRGSGDSDMGEAPSANLVDYTAPSEVKSARRAPDSTAGRSKDEQRPVATDVTDESDIDGRKGRAATRKHRKSGVEGERSTTAKRNDDGDGRRSGKRDRDDHVKVGETPYYDRDWLCDNDARR